MTDDIKTELRRLAGGVPPKVAQGTLGAVRAFRRDAEAAQKALADPRAKSARLRESLTAMRRWWGG
jgi:hypothetical protein